MTIYDVIWSGLELNNQLIKTWAHLGMTEALVPRKGKVTLLNPPIASGYKPVRISWTVD